MLSFLDVIKVVVFFPIFKLMLFLSNYCSTAVEKCALKVHNSVKLLTLNAVFKYFFIFVALFFLVTYATS